jgi:hypothetical protein
MPFMAVIWIGSAFLCAFVGGEKNRSRGSWFLAGLFFGIFAVIAVVAVPKLSDAEREARQKVYPDDPELEEWKRKMKESR